VCSSYFRWAESNVVPVISAEVTLSEGSEMFTCMPNRHLVSSRLHLVPSALF